MFEGSPLIYCHSWHAAYSGLFDACPQAMRARFVTYVGSPKLSKRNYINSVYIFYLNMSTSRVKTCEDSSAP